MISLNKLYAEIDVSRLLQKLFFMVGKVRTKPEKVSRALQGVVSRHFLLLELGGNGRSTSRPATSHYQNVQCQTNHLIPEANL